MPRPRKRSDLEQQRWDNIKLAAENTELRTALFMCAASCQGGHSDAGQAASKALGVPFPIRMDALVAKAKADGYDPDELWPWYKQQIHA
jgi:hypothetical protein